MEIKFARFEVYLISLDPTKDAEIKKTRPCVVISPNEMNKHLKTIIVAPMTTKICAYPTRVSTNFAKKACQVVLDQIRTIDKSRLIKPMGKLPETDSKKITSILQQLFAW